ncbi:MAG: DUF2066 domain-containing protein [Parahaliea sp.]
MIKVFARGSALFLLLAALACPARAELVADLYSGQVPVDSRGRQALERAVGEALSQVLVKVSGSTDVLTLPGIAEALAGDVLSRAQQFSYVRTGDGGPPLAARFDFPQHWVSELLAAAGAPLWTANRPVVLVWLVMDGAGGRQFVNRETAPELVTRLEAGFSRRGVPLRFPLFDLADAAALSPDQAWSLSETNLRQASTRYRVEEILAGRLTRLSSGNWLGDWSYLSAKARSNRSTAPESVDAFLDTGIALVAEDMAARYAVATGASTASGVAMSVSNVRSYADYAAVVSWLEGLELIDRADVEAIRGDRLQLRLQARADATQLASIIELNRQLVPAGPQVGSAGELNYQWQN